jgi:glycosyltransferase involved in cell wall biosynthesis
MRILHLSTRLILGGSQENTVLSCEGQARNGHEVHLAFGPIYGPEGSLLDRVEHFRTDDSRGAGVWPVMEAGRGITTHIVPYLVREISPLADLRCTFALLRLFHRVQPDVIHTHSSKAGILGRLAAARYATKIARERGGEHAPAIVHTVHGAPFHPYQSRAKNALYILSERIAARRCHTIVTVCDAMTKQYLAAGIGRPGQYTTVYSGMDVEPYLTPAPGQSRDEIRALLGLHDSHFVVGTVARLA